MLRNAIPNDSLIRHLCKSKCHPQKPLVYLKGISKTPLLNSFILKGNPNQNPSLQNQLKPKCQLDPFIVKGIQKEFLARFRYFKRESQLGSFQEVYQEFLTNLIYCTRHPKEFLAKLLCLKRKSQLESLTPTKHSQPDPFISKGNPSQTPLFLKEFNRNPCQNTRCQKYH